MPLGALFEMEKHVRGLESAPASSLPCSRAPARSQEEDEVAVPCGDPPHRGQLEAALKSAIETLKSDGVSARHGRGPTAAARRLPPLPRKSERGGRGKQRRKMREENG